MNPTHSPLVAQPASTAAVISLKPTAEAVRAKKMAALASVGSSVLLVCLKTFLAISTGSLAVLSEMLHSSLDLVAAVITYLSVRVADKPADADHLYGHAKVESFSAFVETALLVMTAVYVIYEAIRRLFLGEVHLKPSITAIAILAVAMGIDLLRARSLTRAFKKYPSEALEADALHFSTDVWSTFVVILGITGAWLGLKFHLPWLEYLDAVAALAVSGVILWIGARLAKKTSEALLDVAPSGLRERIEDAVRGMEGVLSADRVRVRRAGQRHFVDVTISVPRTASLEQAHATSEAVERRIAQIVPADVVVHMEPRARRNEHPLETIRAIAQRRGLAVHELSAHMFEGRLFIELHLEVDEASNLSEAHRTATEFEDEIRQVTDHNALVNIHIEPLRKAIASAEEMRDLGRSVQDFLNSLQSEYNEVLDCHDVHVRSVDHKILVSCHCLMHGGLKITEVHDISAALEDRVKETFPQISSVTIHPEPVEEN
jgi:cation diffusion facilitator family transporter